jgi:hypothetical protein
MCFSIFVVNGRTRVFAASASAQFGVNDVYLYREPPDTWKRSIDSMAENGVHLLRIALRVNDGIVPDIVRYATAHGIRTLINIPTGLAPFYPPSTARRAGTKIYWTTYPLSRIDVDKFAQFWRAHLDQMKKAGATAFAYEIGNELNGPGFNGDFPVGPGAHESDAATCDFGKTCEDIQAGFTKYVALLRLVHESEGLRPSLLVSAGMAAIGPEWATSSQGYFFSAPSMIATFHRLGVSKFVDAYGMHRYVNPGNEHGQLAEATAARQLTEAVRDCTAFTDKPCWLTEWGVHAKTTDCSDEPDRDALLAAAIQSLKEMPQTYPLTYAFYFDWDETPSLSLYRCGKLVSPAAAEMWPPK